MIACPTVIGSKDWSLALAGRFLNLGVVGCLGNEDLKL